jgi:hypothetical protein
MDDDIKNPLKSLSSIPVQVSLAERGDFQAATDILRKASELLAQGEPLPRELADWIGECLQRVLEGQKAKNAFRLNKTSGRPSPYSAEFQRLVADTVHTAPGGLHKTSSADGKSMGALLEAEEAHDVDAKTAKKHYEKHIDDILAEEEIKQEFRKENNDR